MMSSAILGTWEVIRCEPSPDKNSFKGIRFRLRHNGDVIWYVPEELKQIPLFNCTIYDTNTPLYSSRSTYWVRFGEYEGEIIEFEIDPKNPKDTVIFKAEGLFTLYCRRADNERSEEFYEVDFNLLPALEEGFFSDITLVSSDKKEFHVHSSILNIIGNGIDWHSQNHPLKNLPQDVLGNILHYMYAECLPEDSNEESVQKLLSVAKEHCFLNKLSLLCQKYLRNAFLRTRIVDLINEIHDSVDKLMENIKPKHSLAVEYLIANPGHLCNMIKNCIRDAAVGFVKLVELCEVYHRIKPEFNKNEQCSLVTYGKSRFFILVAQMTQFLEMLKGSYGSMTPYQKNEIATLLVPEVSGILDMLTELLMKINESLERIIAFLGVEEMNKSRLPFGNSSSHFLHMKGAKFLKKISEAVTCSYELVKQKRRNFMEMSEAQKVRSISLNIEEIVHEMPVFFMVRLEDLINHGDKILAFRDFRFFFQTCTSKISNFLQLIGNHKHEFQDLVSRVCELVQRDSFNRTMQNLGFLEKNSADTDGDEKKTDESAKKPNKYTHKINLVKSQLIPPKGNDNILSKTLWEQCNNSSNTDMEFEIVNYYEGETAEEVKETCVIKSHRVVAASRCDWFRKALLSGMKEDIDKKIVIHETNPDTFKIYLEFLYRGKVSFSSIAHEHLVELVVISDRFEMDALKQSCELALMKTVNDDNAVYLLSFSESYHTKNLRMKCVSYICRNQELTKTDLYQKLSPELQAHISHLIWNSTMMGCPKPKRSTRRRRSSSEGGTDFDALFAKLHLREPDPERVRMERSISEMRDIVGEDAPRDKIVRMILAADFDLSRAVNYYYARKKK